MHLYNILSPRKYSRVQFMFIKVLGINLSFMVSSLVSHPEIGFYGQCSLIVQWCWIIEDILIFLKEENSAKEVKCWKVLMHIFNKKLSGVVHIKESKAGVGEGGVAQ